MRKLLSLVATVGFCAATLTPSTSATAATFSRSDATSDASPPTYDVVATSLTFDKSNIVVTTDYAGAVPPLTDPIWTSGERTFIAGITFNNAEYGAIIAVIGGEASGTYLPPGADNNQEAFVDCPATATISGNRLTLTTPSSCYGYPGKLAYFVVSSGDAATTDDLVPSDLLSYLNDQPSEPGGYYLLGADGGVFSFGDAKFHGSTGNLRLNQPVVGMSRSGNGYRFVASDGGVFTYNTTFHGSKGNQPLNKPVVGMATTPSGNGYWLVASDGGIFTFGDAKFFGSTGSMTLNKPVVGMARTASGNGYYLVASDGGIFTFGDAQFKGSTGNLRLNSPVTGMARSEGGAGYYLVAGDGGVFPFGDAPFRGSAVGKVSGTATAISVDAGGYRVADTSGRVTEFGTVYDFGDLIGEAVVPNRPVIGMS